MGLGRVLVRSSPNQAPAGPVYPGPPSTFMSGPEQTFGQGPTVLPQPSETTALSVPAFWRAFAYVTDTVGMLPCTAYRGTDAVDPQPPVIVQPDPNQTPMAFWAAMTASLALYGNAVSIITSTDRGGWPLTLKPIHPTLAAVRFTGNPMAPEILTWYVAGKMYDPSEIWHVKSSRARAGWPLGRGVIDMESDAIATSIALQTYAASYFNSGGMPSGILKVHRPEVTQTQADDLKATWLSKFSGAPTPAILNELTDFTPVAYRPVDSQMVESRGFELIQIANMWGLPASKLGGTTGGGTYKNAEMEEVQARNDAIMPWTRLLEQAASLELLPRGQRLVWDLAAALRTDTLTQYQAYQAALGGPGPTSAWLLVDEIRARENLDPMADVEAEIAASSPNTPPPQQPTPPPVAGGPPAATPVPPAMPAPMPLPPVQAQMKQGGP
jgi:HK97 family phage portal protein